MQFRRLGRSELMVAEVGLGVARLAALGTDEGAAALRAGFAYGVNLVEVDVRDDAALALVAAAIEGVRSQLVLVGTGPAEADTVRSALARLNSRHFDCFLAADDDGIDLGALQALALDGAARSIGVATEEPERALAAILEGAVEVVQLPLHLLELAQPTGVDAALNAAQAADVGVLACSPLAGGRLGAHGEAPLLEELAFLADGPPTSPSEGALAWVLSESRVGALVCGPSSAEQARSCARTSGYAPLDADTLERVFDTVRRLTSA